MVDGVGLPARPLEAVALGAARDVELIVCTTAHEMQLYQLFPGFGELDDAQLAAHVATRLPAGTADAEKRVEAICAAYDDFGDDLRSRFFAVETDASLWIPATRLAEAQARHNASTWMARFTWPSPMLEGRLGACHALDVPFTLGNHRLDAVRAFAGEGPGADAVAAQLMGAWSRFAHKGDPTPPGGPAWPAYEPTRRATLEINSTCQLVDAPNEARRRLWPAD